MDFGDSEGGKRKRRKKRKIKRRVTMTRGTPMAAAPSGSTYNSYYMNPGYPGAPGQGNHDMGVFGKKGTRMPKRAREVSMASSAKRPYIPEESAADSSYATAHSEHDLSDFMGGYGGDDYSDMPTEDLGDYSKIPDKTFEERVSEIIADEDADKTASTIVEALLGGAGGDDKGALGAPMFDKKDLAEEPAKAESIADIFAKLKEGFDKAKSIIDPGPGAAGPGFGPLPGGGPPMAPSMSGFLAGGPGPGAGPLGPPMAPPMDAAAALLAEIRDPKVLKKVEEKLKVVADDPRSALLRALESKVLLKKVETRMLGTAPEALPVDTKKGDPMAILKMAAAARRAAMLHSATTEDSNSDDGWSDDDDLDKTVVERAPPKAPMAVAPPRMPIVPTAVAPPKVAPVAPPRMDPRVEPPKVAPLPPPRVPIVPTAVVPPKVAPVAPPRLPDVPTALAARPMGEDPVKAAQWQAMAKVAREKAAAHRAATAAAAALIPAAPVAPLAPPVGPPIMAGGPPPPPPPLPPFLGGPPAAPAAPRIAAAPKLGPPVAAKVPFKVAAKPVDDDIDEDVFHDVPEESDLMKEVLGKKLLKKDRGESAAERRMRETAERAAAVDAGISPFGKLKAAKASPAALAYGAPIDPALDIHF